MSEEKSKSKTNPEEKSDLIIIGISMFILTLIIYFSIRSLTPLIAITFLIAGIIFLVCMIYIKIYRFIKRKNILSNTWNSLYPIGWITGATSPLFWIYLFIAYTIFNETEPFYNNSTHKRIAYYSIVGLIIIAIYVSLFMTGFILGFTHSIQNQ